jgi:four helix bundle protein
MFDHEKLDVYQRSLVFTAWVGEILERLPKGLSAFSHLDRASTSIPLNIAEGNGKFTAADRCKFFDIGRGSALECAAALDVLVARKCVAEEAVRPGKEHVKSIVSMLVGLIRSTSPDRVYESGAPYEAGQKLV